MCNGEIDPLRDAAREGLCGMAMLKAILMNGARRPSGHNTAGGDGPSVVTTIVSTG